MRHVFQWGKFINQKNSPNANFFDFILAEIGGFEPSIQFPVYTISSRAHSTSSAISPVLVLLHWFICFARALYFKIVIFDRFDDGGNQFILVRGTF